MLCAFISLPQKTKGLGHLSQLHVPLRTCYQGNSSMSRCSHGKSKEVGFAFLFFFSIFVGFLLLFVFLFVSKNRVWCIAGWPQIHCVSQRMTLTLMTLMPVCLYLPNAEINVYYHSALFFLGGNGVYIAQAGLKVMMCPSKSWDGTHVSLSGSD